MKEDSYRLPESAEMLKIDKTTLRNWAKTYDVELGTNDFGFKVITEKQLDYFKQIKKISKNYPNNFKNRHEIIKKVLLSKSIEPPVKEVIKNNYVQEPEAKKDDLENKKDETESSSTLDFILNNLDVKATFTNEALREMIKKSIALEQENKRLQACK